VRRLSVRVRQAWKDCVATFMSNNAQNDWNLWVKFAVYAHDSAWHSTVALTPNELMMGRRLRPPNELLRRTEVTEAGELMQYHERLLLAMERSHECAEAAREKEQARQARYYNRRVRQKRTFVVGDRVWVYNPPRGPKATKFVHQWQGPMRIVEAAGYENFVLKREDKTGTPEVLIAHVSFLVSYHQPESLLPQVAADLRAELDEEDEDESAGSDGPETRAPVRAATAARRTAATGPTAKRRRGAASGSQATLTASGGLVENRRRRMRNSAGQYVLEHELRPAGRERNGEDDGGRWWVSAGEYERLWQDGRVVEDPTVEEVV
jgi:hypothetical protein